MGFLMSTGDAEVDLCSFKGARLLGGFGDPNFRFLDSLRIDEAPMAGTSQCRVC